MIGPKPYIVKHVKFSEPDSADLHFCVIKHLSISVADQTGVASAVISAGTYGGYVATAAFKDLQWEACTDGYQQVLTLDYSDNHGAAVISTTSYGLLGEHTLSADRSTLTFTGACSDICVSGTGAWMQPITTEFESVMGGSTSDFSIVTTIVGNPCAEGQEIADGDHATSMQLEVGDLGQSVTCDVANNYASSGEVQLSSQSSDSFASN